MSDPLCRREAALRIAAMACAAPAVLRAARTQRVGFALIGAGAWGQHLLSHANAVESGRCVALCDLDGTKLAQAVHKSRDNPHGCRDYREVLGRKDVDAVVVATPLYTHFQIVRDALQAGKHVQCEPPLAFTPEEVHALREILSRSDRVVQVGLQRRYSKFYQTAKQMVSKGFIGDVTNIQAQWHCPSMPALNREGQKENYARYYREFSGGLTSELASHQIDVANWMFSDNPDHISGVGGLDWKKDGRDTYDNIALILRYPEGRQLLYSAITSSGHLPYLGGTRTECGEVIMGTEGSIEISLGAGDKPPLGMWFYEPTAAKVSRASDSKEIARAAGATVATSPAGESRGTPILLDRDQITGDESFWQRELKYGRRWMYSKGIALPEEDRHPVRAELEGFFDCCVSGLRPKAHAQAGLDNSAAVILANLAMDQGRRVQFAEMERMGRAVPRRKARC